MNDFVVVDTNVPIAACGGNEVSTACYQACRSAVLDVLEYRTRLVIDADWQIIGEYRHKLSQTGQPRLGDAFLKWVLRHQATTRVDRVAVSPKAGSETDFTEFPAAPGLEAFDPSDRKFVAVANAHPEKQTILQGLDSKWWGWREALAGAGIKVAFLCSAEVKATYNKKFGAQSPGPRGRRRD